MSTPEHEGQRSDRLTDLELLFMHLERQVAELNQIVLEQGRKIERLERELCRQRDEAGQDDEPANEEPGDGATWQ